MDRLFLDANILFCAAYRHSSGLLVLCRLKDVTLCMSRSALEEARINLSDEAQRHRLIALSGSMHLFEAPDEELAEGVRLPEKDVPIMLAAMAAQSTHLLTGDVRHFGPYFGRRVCGILILPPADYLQRRTAKS